MGRAQTHPGRIILASASPRRRELLAALGIDPRVMPVDADESVLPGETPILYVERLARMKAELIAVDDPEAIIIAADTAVTLGGRIFGKPTDMADFRRMMEALSGRCHDVYTGVAVRFRGRTAAAISSSRVCLRALTTEEIQRYWESGEPGDKAGGYAIQGLGSIFVRELAGSYSGVVGLPMFETAELLARAGVDLLSPTSQRGRRAADG